MRLGIGVVTHKDIIVTNKEGLNFDYKVLDDGRMIYATKGFMELVDSGLTLP